MASRTAWATPNSRAARSGWPLRDGHGRHLLQSHGQTPFVSYIAKRLEPTPPAGSRQGQVVIVLGTDDSRVDTYARYRERLGIVHRPGARYSARLQ
jgi:hypothetical protein